MNRKTKFLLTLSAVCGILFALLMVLLCAVDVKPIGPLESKVGLATINGALYDFFGQSQLWYKITEVIGLVAFLPLVIAVLLGVHQLITRHSLKQVDADIRACGAFVVVVGLLYVLFEKIIINYRPVLEEGRLAASFPSSHTLLACCFLFMGVLLARTRLPRLAFKGIGVFSVLLAALTAMGRLLAGVHWFTDVLGSLLLSAALCMLLYAAYSNGVQNKEYIV